MLILRHTSSFDRDPYLDKFNLAFISTLGTVVYLILFMLILKLPEATFGMLVGALSIVMCSLSFLFDKKQKLQALLFMMLVVTFATYSITIAAYSPTAALLWVIPLAFIVYTPTIKWPKYIAYSSVSLTLALVALHFPGAGSLYVANNRLIIFISVLFISGLIILLYPEQLVRKRRVAIWLILEAVASLLNCQNDKEQRVHMQKYHDNLLRYNNYPKKENDLYSTLVFSTQQLALSAIFHANQQTLSHIITPAHQVYLQSMIDGFANIKSVQEGILPVPDSQSPNKKSSDIINNQLNALLLAINQYIHKVQR